MGLLMMRRWKVIVACCWLCCGVLSANCHARPQQQADAAPQKVADKSQSASREPEKPSPDTSKPADPENRLGLTLLKNIANDQKTIGNSPRHLRFVDAGWLLPLGVATGVTLATDTGYSRLSN